MIDNRNKTNIEQREYHFKVLPYQNIVSSQPRQVFHYDAVNNTAFDVCHHALKIRTHKIRAAPAIIHIFVHKDNIVTLFDVVVGDILLRANTVAFLFVTVLS